MPSPGVVSLLCHAALFLVHQQYDTSYSPSRVSPTLFTVLKPNYGAYFASVICGPLRARLVIDTANTFGVTARKPIPGIQLHPSPPKIPSQQRIPCFTWLSKPDCGGPLSAISLASNPFPTDFRAWISSSKFGNFQLFMSSRGHTSNLEMWGSIKSRSIPRESA